MVQKISEYTQTGKRRRGRSFTKWKSHEQRKINESKLKDRDEQVMWTLQMINLKTKVIKNQNTYIKVSHLYILSKIFITVNNI